jgi:hypothetical protein
MQEFKPYANIDFSEFGSVPDSDMGDSSHLNMDGAKKFSIKIKAALFDKIK